MDYFAVTTLGIFPTPTPTNSERAAYFCSWGMLDFAPAYSGEEETYTFMPVRVPGRIPERTPGRLEIW